MIDTHSDSPRASDEILLGFVCEGNADCFTALCGTRPRCRSETAQLREKPGLEVHVSRMMRQKICCFADTLDDSFVRD